MKLIHYYKVARHFTIWTQEFWLAICHDLVEDGYVGRWACIWSGLDAITRRKNEVYMDYINRVSRHQTAKKVKLADLDENINRCSESLAKRYIKAIHFLNLNDEND